jgi:hypothetical protein
MGYSGGEASMIAQLKDLDQRVHDAAMSFPGVVVRIGYSIGHDWNGDPAIFFRVVLSDDASRPEVLADNTGRVGGKLFDDLRLDDSDYTPYFYFRSKSEQDQQKDPEWQSLTIS